MTWNAASHQRRDGYVDGADFAGRRLEAELVQVANACVLPHAIELFDELRRENGFQGLGESLPARDRVHHFHLRVPALNAVLHVERHHAHVDGFDDVFVEVFQALVLRSFLLQRGVELSVLNGDAEIAAEGLEQLHVFAGEEVALGRLAQPEHSDGFLLSVAGNVVVQIEPGDGLLRFRGLAGHLVRVLEEKMSRRFRPGRAQES